MDDFKQLSKIFKNEFSDYTFKIRRVKMGDGCAGDCNCLNKAKNEFLIRINRCNAKDEQLLWLLHEVAHAISFHTKGDDHSVYWAKAYSKCYKIYLDKFVNGPDE